MIPVTQTILASDEPGAPKGNCMQAAVASLLEMDLNDVPHFADIVDLPGAADWWAQFESWAYDHGYSVMTCAPAPNDQALGLLGGRSERGIAHLCVGRGNEVVHDPHPSRSGLVSITSWWYLVPFNPVR